jgi:hypothetical protein
MPRTIDRIRAKVTRAKQHIQDFQLALKAFYNTNPYRVEINEDTQSGKRIYYVAKADPIPDDTVVAIATDVLQNLRAVLDQIAFQLEVIGNGGSEPKHRVYFPIANSASEYPTTRNTNIKSMRKDAIDAIDATQPYKGGQGHALWQLNALNKADKHKIMVAAGSFYGGVDISGTVNIALKCMGIDFPDIEPLFIKPADKLLSMKVGDPLYSEPLGHEMDKNRRFAFDPSFHEPNVIQCEPASKTLQDMTNLVDALFTTLEPLFP